VSSGVVVQQNTFHSIDFIDSPPVFSIHTLFICGAKMPGAIGKFQTERKL
jgi:hypothetical protein